jgi:hypothetical protein
VLPVWWLFSKWGSMTRNGYLAVNFSVFCAVVLMVALWQSPSAQAACVSPGGQSSYPLFKTNVGIQFCPDGDNWSTFLANGAGVPGGSTGHVQFNNAGVFAGDVGLFWDNTNKRLGIGTATPDTTFQVSNPAKNYAGTTPSPSDFVFISGADDGGANVAIGRYNAMPAIQGMGTGTSYALLLNPAAGNVGIGTVTPSAKLEVAGAVKAEQVETGYFKEFSGKISEPSPDYPTCATPYKDVTLGTLTSGSNGGMEVVVIGTHRGYNNTSYMEYRNFVVVYGDNVSSAQISSAGTGSNINLLNGGSTGPYSNVAIGGGYSVKLRITSSCGSARTYHYVVKYSGTTFTPSTTRDW